MTGFRKIVDFLESKGFRQQLVNACRDFEILSEADLQTFVCCRLSKLLKVTGVKYRVNAQPFCRELNYYPDIGIFRRHVRLNHEPSVVIELKEGHSFGDATEHDCRKLVRYRKSIGVRRAYIIHLSHSGSRAEFEQKLASAKNGMRNVEGIGIAMEEELGKQAYQKWHEMRHKVVNAFANKKAVAAAAN